MLPIEIVRKIMLYNIHPLAVVMKYYIIEYEECELAYLQEYGDKSNQFFKTYMLYNVCKSALSSIFLLQYYCDEKSSRSD